MKNNGKKMLCNALALCMIGTVFAFSACNEVATTLNVFESSDKSLDKFLNEYMEKHIGYNDNKVITFRLGTGVTYAKFWEEKSLSWFDHDILGSNIESSIRTQLKETPQDAYGMIFNANNNFRGANETGVAGGNPFCWPFPLYNKSNGNSTGWEFSNSTEDWYVEGSGELTYDGGFASVMFDGAKNEELVLKTRDFLSIKNKTYSTEHCPIIELDMRLNNLHKRRATSRKKENVVETVADLSNTYGSKKSE